MADVPPAGVLVISVWIERGAADGLRARIAQLTDVHDGEPVGEAAATIDDVCAAVRRWLDAFVEEWERS